MDAHYITPIILAVQTTPEAPPEAGFFYLYGKADGRLYGMNAAGVEKLAEFPTTADFVAANDARLTNARNPTSHAHDAADLASGTLDSARLGSGGAAGKFLRFDSTWQTIAGGGDVLAANNLSDLLSAAVARTNLGLGTAATTAATAYATAAQGTTADLAAVATTMTTLLALKAPLAAPTFTGTLNAATVTASGNVTGLNLSGTNTGDNATNTLYSGLVTNATHTGEVTGSGALTITDAAVTLSKMANIATASLIYRKTAGAGVPEVNTLATLKTDLTLVKADVGLGSVENTALSTWTGSANITTLGTLATGAVPTTLLTGAITNAQLAGSIAYSKLTLTGAILNGDLAGSIAYSKLTLTGAVLNADLAGSIALSKLATDPVARGNHTGTQTASTISDFTSASAISSYRTILSVAGSHTAARVAGTYAVPNGEALAITGTGTLYPIGLIHIAAADYPTANALTAKLRIRMQVECNDVAPTGNFTAGLYPITRPASSGGAGLVIYTLGTVVSGSNGATVSTPAADSSSLLAGSDFALPSDGLYCIGVVTTATVATSAHVHVNAQLQHRNA